MKRKPRVLLTYIESGMGHIMSMKAIQEGLSKKYGDKLDIFDPYIMESNLASRKFEEFLSSATKETNKNKAFGMGIFVFLDLMGKQHFMRLVHKTIFKKFTDATIDEMRKYQPDVIISTHYFITFCAIELKKRYLPHLLVITYNPDNNVHVWWDNRSDLFINNNLAACGEAIYKRNFDLSQVRQVYFTAREEVAKATGSRLFYRKKHELPERFTIMIADGAYASGKAKKVCDRLLKLDIECTIIMLAGKNQKVYDYFKKKKPKPNINLVVLPFRDDAYEFYGASDIFVSKAGPNATLDSLFMGTPVIFDYYAHPIEKATANLFADELHCAVKVYHLSKIKEEVVYLYNHPEFLKVLEENIAKNVNKSNNGADQVADIIMRKIEQDFPSGEDEQ